MRLKNALYALLSPRPAFPSSSLLSPPPPREQCSPTLPNPQRLGGWPRPRPAPGWPISGSAPGASKWRSRARGPAPGLLPTGPCPSAVFTSFRLSSVSRIAPRLPGEEGGVWREPGSGAGKRACCSRVLGRRTERGQGALEQKGVPEAALAHLGREMLT